MGPVHQLVHSFSCRDAIGDHAIRLRDLIRRQGAESEIFYLEVNPNAVNEGRPVKELAADPTATLIYQASIGSPLAKMVVGRPEKLLVNYHNVTPAEFFSAWMPEISARLAAGRTELVELAPRCQHAIADSAFNAGELIDVGFGSVSVAPVLVDVSRGVVDEGLVSSVRGAGSVWLFVGRLVPNKAVHDLISSFFVYRELFDSDAVLLLVGSDSFPSYVGFLRDLVARLGLGESVRMVGSVSDSELASYYSAADVFVCLSEHEGFCVPLLEAMAYDLPIVGFSAGAVPETLADAGLLLDVKSPELVAVAVNRLVQDKELRDELVLAGRERLADFDIKKTETTWLNALTPHLGNQT